MAVTGKKKSVLAQLLGLRGNARATVYHEPLWSIPYGLYNFYLSLYMKSQGVTDVQIGFLISLSFIVGTVLAMFGGVVADKLGRRNTCLIFGLISWPGSVLLNFLARNFWGFALAQVVLAIGKISDISWQLILIEDADEEDQLASFNLFGIIDILSGFFTPLAGIAVANLGLVKAERGFLLLAFLCMTGMIIHRHFQYHETEPGKAAMARSRSVSIWGTLKENLAQMKGALGGGSRRLPSVLAIVVLFNAYQPIGAYSSLYFAPYLTDVVGLDAAAISVLGTVNALFLLGVYLLLVPFMTRFNRLFSLCIGLGLQMTAMALRILIPYGSFGWTVASVAVFALGFGLCRPFLDALMAQATSEEQRSGVYTLKNMLAALGSALAGTLSGFLYRLQPSSIYLASLAILAVCVLLILRLYLTQKREA